ncbi:MAG: Na+/H+ antiporter NhaC family protein [Clostridiales bacterium]|nr:Na+/H+ antiporter NhaC family protein [Clostridiales bacterium]
MSKTGRILLLILAAALAGTVIYFTCTQPGTVDTAAYAPAVYGTFSAMLPPIIAIVLALVTKEVYTSLFIGIAAGALLYANGNMELMFNTMLFNQDGGMIFKLADTWNVGILVFLVVLGILVCLMNKVGGSAAFGRWASAHIKSRVGAQIATFALGVMIFVDDYFNCLTVGSVMKPVTDRHKVSRAKLAYLIDATAAPICIIAPVSSWAAAVTSSVPEGMDINGFSVFLQTIPFNLYALCTLAMILLISLMQVDFGSMRIHEQNALSGDLFTTADRPYGEAETEQTASSTGKVIDLIIPVLVLILSCVAGMVYTGGFFSGVNFIDAFANADASAGLVLGSMITLVFTFLFYICRGVLSFKDCTATIPEGFKAMVAPILILTMAWTLSGVTGLLGAKEYVYNLVNSSAMGLQMFLPCIIFAVAAFLAFSTGTSWGTFAILIPIVCDVFGSTPDMMIISIAACLSGAVSGDHCSPISDTTIMASAGANCDHVNHISTQLPYAIFVAVISFVGYLLAGVLGYHFGSQTALLSLPFSLLLLVVSLLIVRTWQRRKTA